METLLIAGVALAAWLTMVAMVWSARTYDGRHERKPS